MSPAAARSGLRLVDERPPGPGLSDFELWLRSRGCAEHTITDRLTHLAQFARAHPRFPSVRSIELSAWLGRPGYAAWSRATYYGHLRSYFTFALENDLLSVDPMARMRRPHVAVGKPRPLTPAEVELVMGAAKTADMRAWLTLGLYAGLRAHEIAKLRGEDVTQDMIFVVGKGGESAEIPTHPLVWQLAQSRPREGWWFPFGKHQGHVHVCRISALTSQLFTDNGIPGSLHRCRHTYATALLRAGVNIRVVQELMRHKSLASTMVYTLVDEEERIDGINRLPVLRAAVVPASEEGALEHEG